MRIAILDLPVPYEPVEVDLDTSLKEQFSGEFLEVVYRFLKEFEDVNFLA